MNHSRAQSEPPSRFNASSRVSSVEPRLHRSRAPSDPFIDTPAGSLRALADSDIGEEGSFPELQNDLVSSAQAYKIPNDEEQLRIWTSPDLPNPELLSLLSVFPAFVTGRTLPRFPVVSPNRRQRQADLEEGILDDATDENVEVRIGTGSMWIGTMERSDGWRGSLWQRFIQWWRRLFC